MSDILSVGILLITLQLSNAVSDYWQTLCYPWIFQGHQSVWVCLHVCLFVRQCTWKPVYWYGMLGYPALKADRLKPHVNHATDLSLTSTVTFSLLSESCAESWQVVEIKSSFQPVVHNCWTARRMAAGGSKSFYMPSRSCRGSPYIPYPAVTQLSCNRLTPLRL